jgi:hypothetical protein
VTEYKYISEDLPPIPEEPVGMDYQTVVMKINGKTWYATDKVNSGIMLNNYNTYKDYTATLRRMLEKVKSND